MDPWLTCHGTIILQKSKDPKPDPKDLFFHGFESFEHRVLLRKAFPASSAGVLLNCSFDLFQDSPVCWVVSFIIGEGFV